MIYIHTLKDLTPKTAEIESTQIIRELKGKTKLPLSEQQTKEDLGRFFQEEDIINTINHSINLIDPTINDIISLIEERNSLHELINLQRGISMLREIKDPLLNTLDYTKDILSLKDSLIDDMYRCLDRLSKLKTQEEMNELNDRVKKIFSKMLRSDGFTFNHLDIIGEPQLSRINDLSESMNNGFFFHISVEEHLRKYSFDVIKRRIPLNEIKKIEDITKKINKIRMGVKVAYDFNMGIINMSVVFYSYIKWLMNK